LRAFIKAAVAHPHYAEAAETRQFFGLPPASEAALAAAAMRAAVAAALSAAPLLHRLPQQWRVTLQGALEAAVAITSNISSSSSSGSSSTGNSSTGGTNAVSSDNSSGMTNSSAAGAAQAGVSAPLLQSSSSNGTSFRNANSSSASASGGTHQQRFDGIGAAAFAGQPTALRQVFFDGGPDNAFQVSALHLYSVCMYISVLFCCDSVLAAVANAVAAVACTSKQYCSNHEYMQALQQSVSSSSHSIH
jgi:hypothetical protein